MRVLVDHVQRGYKGLGDIVCEMSFYRALRGLYPEAHIASRNSRMLAWGNPCIDAFDQDSSDESFDRIIRIPHYTPLMQDLTASLPEAIATKRRIFDHVLGSQGFDPLPSPPELFVLPREIESLGFEDDGGEELVIAFSVDSREVDRRWGEERFHSLLQRLEQTERVCFVELGSGLTAGHLGLGLDLVGRTDLRQTMAALAMADLFIGNHGGLTHLAGGVGTPILAPWGASAPYHAYAYDTLSVALETDPSCRHCIWTREIAPECRSLDALHGRTPCTQAISVEQMLDAALPLLSSLREGREALRERKWTRQQMARDPRSLGTFEAEGEVTPYTHVYQVHGGLPGWHEEHSGDGFARLPHAVAMLDWRDPLHWRTALDTYCAQIDAAAPWVLALPAGDLTGPEIMALLSDYLRDKPRAPKILAILGALSEGERRALLDGADARLGC